MVVAVEGLRFTLAPRTAPFGNMTLSGRAAQVDQCTVNGVILICIGMFLIF